jgi:hypothetical protein
MLQQYPVTTVNHVTTPLRSDCSVTAAASATCHAPATATGLLHSHNQQQVEQPRQHPPTTTLPMHQLLGCCRSPDMSCSAVVCLGNNAGRLGACPAGAEDSRRPFRLQQAGDRAEGIVQIYVIIPYMNKNTKPEHHACCVSCIAPQSLPGTSCRCQWTRHLVLPKWQLTAGLRIVEWTALMGCTHVLLPTAG